MRTFTLNCTTFKLKCQFIEIVLCYLIPTTNIICNEQNSHLFCSLVSSIKELKNFSSREQSILYKSRSDVILIVVGEGIVFLQRPSSSTLTDVREGAFEKYQSWSQTDYWFCPLEWIIA